MKDGGVWHTFLAVMFVLMQSEAIVTGALVATHCVLTHVLTATILYCTLILVCNTGASQCTTLFLRTKNQILNQFSWKNCQPYTFAHLTSLYTADMWCNQCHWYIFALSLTCEEVRHKARLLHSVVCGEGQTQSVAIRGDGVGQLGATEQTVTCGVCLQATAHLHRVILTVLLWTEKCAEWSGWRMGQATGTLYIMWASYVHYN